MACAPQAWAAGSVPLLLQASLGLEVDARASRVVLTRPRLPFELKEIRIHELIGEAIPGAWLRNPAAQFAGFPKRAIGMAKTQLDALSAMAADLDRARGDHAAFLLAERIATPMRRRRQRLVEEHRTERRVRQALADSWERRTSVEAIEELIARRYTGGDAKDQARRAAGSAILELIRADVFRASQDFARELPNELELFLAEYAPTASFPAEPEVPRLVELVSPRMDVVWSPG